MKYNKIIILLLFAILFAYGCEELPIGENFLTKAPGVDVTVDTVFNKMEYAERYLAGAYDYFRKCKFYRSSHQPETLDCPDGQRSYGNHH
jgi:hypothetical protein